MKILQVITQSVVGGAQSVVIELSNSLSQDGHHVVVLSKPDGPMWDLLDSSISKITCDNFIRNVSPVHDIKAYFFIRNIIKKEKPDIIHLHTSKVGLLGRLAAWPYYTKKTYYTMHGFDAIIKANKKYLPLEKIFKNFCKRIIAVSKYDEVNLNAHAINNTCVIYNAIKDIEDASSLDQKVVTKIKDCAQGKKIVLTVARVSKQKRFESFKELAQNMPEYSFIWIGNSEKMINLPENLHCLGEIPNAGSYIAIADIFVLLSNYEGLPVSIIEALACGKPVLASNVGGIPEILQDDCGFALDNDITLFKEKIKEILNNDGTYKQLSNNARSKYEEYFTVNIMQEKYITLFKSNS